MSSSHVLQTSAGMSSLDHTNGLPYTSTSTLTGWPYHRFNSRQATRPAEIGCGPIHSLSRRSSHSSMSRDVGVSSISIANHAREGDQEHRHKLSRSQSTSSRALSDWVRRRKGDNNDSPAESPISSAIRGLTLPPVGTNGGAESMEELADPQQPSASTLHRSSSSSGGSHGGGLSRLFSGRRKQKTTLMNDAGLIRKGSSLQRSPHKVACSDDLVNLSSTTVEPSTTLQALDLNRPLQDNNEIGNSPAQTSSSHFSALLRRGSRRVRTKSASKDGVLQSEQIASPQKYEGTRRRKLSVAGLNLFRANVQGREPPTTPEIETWKETTSSASKNLYEDQKQEQVEGQTEESLQIRSSSAETELSSRALLARSSGPLRKLTDDQLKRFSISDEERRASALGLIPGAGRDSPEFTACLDAISSDSTEASSMRISTSRRRKPVPHLDFSAVAEGESTMDSTLPSLQTGHRRPYSLISTDTEANDTPIVRLQNFVVDTKENIEEDSMKQSQFFFRPLNENGTRISSRIGSNGQEIEYVHDDNSPEVATCASEAGPIATEASVPSSGSSTLNVRLISAQMQRALQVRRKEEEEEAFNVAGYATRSFAYSPPPNQEEENELQYQQLSPPRHLRLSALTPVQSPHGLLNFRRESGVSSQTDTSVHEAILSRAVSTRLRSVPLRRMNVEEWAKQLAMAEKGNENGNGTEINDSRHLEVHNASRDIPNETVSSQDNFSAAIEAQEKARQSFCNLSEAARLGKVPSKRSRPSEGSEEVMGSKGEVSEPVVDMLFEDKASRHQRNYVDESQKTMMPIKKEIAPTKQKNSKEDSEELDKQRKASEPQSIQSKLDLKTKEAKKSSRHRAGHERGHSTTKSYLTSEEAAVAKRKEKEERERKRKEKRRRKELEKQRAYAERKRADPLLRTRLALVGLASADDEVDKVEEKQTKLPTQLYSTNIENESSGALSRTSFHTAQEEGEEEGEEGEEKETLHINHANGGKRNERMEIKQVHRRNQASTASDATMMTLASRSSYDTLAPSAMPVFPEPPRRHDVPTRSEDGTILARARLESREGHDEPLLVADALNGQAHILPSTEERCELVIVDGHKVFLSNGALVRVSPALIRKPDLKDKNLVDGFSRRSHIPEIHDRFSVQSCAR